MTNIFLGYLNSLSDNINKAIDILRKENPNISVKEHDNLAIFKYNSKYGNEIDRNCRGLIIDKTTKKIICQSNNGSITFEDFISKVPINKCVVEENLEGTLINLYYYKERWCVSTKFCIHAENSKFRGNKSFRQYFDKLFTTDLEQLDKNFTYSFLLQVKENRMVSHIPKKQLYHIETINNTTGEKICLDIGIDKPKILKLNDLNTLKISGYRDINRELVKLDWQTRGFMLYSLDRKYRCSLINPSYQSVFDLVKDQADLKYLILESLYYKKNINDITFYFPEYTKIQKKVTEDVDDLINELLKLYKDCYCFKNIEISELPKLYKKILSKIHAYYKITHQNNILFKITYGDIKETLFKQKCAYIYSMLYKNS